MIKRLEGGKSRIRIARRLVQAAFLGLFVYLVVAAAYPPVLVPPSNLMLRFDPVSGIAALMTTGDLSVAAGFLPAWIIVFITLFSSRFFCGWICPLGTCFDIAGAVKPRILKYYRPRGKAMKALLKERRAGVIPRRLRLKYLVLAVVLVLVVAGVNLLFFFSPVAIFNRGLYYILLPQVPVFFLVLMLLAFAYRPRFWCEEICPVGALFSLASMAGKKLRSSFSPLSVVKDPEACISCGACYKHCDFGVEEPYVKQDAGRLRSADCTACGECVARCPAQEALSLESFGGRIAVSKGSATRPVSGSDITGEGQEKAAVETARPLTVSRKEFVASLGLGAVMLTGFGIGLRGVEEPLLRMPGAQDETEFLSRCIRCGECTRACPTGCINPMGLEGGFQKLMTPRFYPRTACCTFDRCDQACARVCPVGAIERQGPEQVLIGTAAIDRQRCLAYQGGICLACKERCRFDAIDVDDRRRPHVNRDLCTGCGACQMTCPTEPASIQVFPAGSAPSFGGGSRNRGGRGTGR